MGALASLLASLVLAGCGGGSEASVPAWKVTGTASPPSTQIPPNPGPPPRKLIVKKLKKGTGIPLEEGDSFTLNYIVFDYGTGQQIEVHWGRSKSFSWTYRKGTMVEAWVPGLRGMRVGERRELIVPSRLAYGNGALVYVVELLEAKGPDGRAPSVSSSGIRE